MGLSSAEVAPERLFQFLAAAREVMVAVRSGVDITMAVQQANIAASQTKHFDQRYCRFISIENYDSTTVLPCPPEQRQQ